ncbi:MAG: DNA-binding protein [Mesorhizobium sp.]|nr:MAG: DNA-binding protein [Mesorhizobium sp.]
MSTKPNYLDTFPSVDPGRPLVIPVSPKAGEGLPELVLRAASENSYTATSTVLLVSGLSGRYAAGIATNAIGHEQALASTLGVEGGKETIVNLIYRPVEDRPGWHEFFGTPMRVAHREVLRRRVSPLALRQSNHGRAVWSVKVLSFDPATKETLLDKCPECGTWLGYGISYGVSSCGKCLHEDTEGFIRGRIDLRDYPQPRVEVEDMEALDFVTGLIDPNPEVRSSFRPALPEALQSYSRGGLFEFAVALACAITADPAKITAFLPRPGARDEYSRFSPEVLALAGRTILSWPKGFDRLASMARENADLRKGHFGIKKELGALLALRLDPHIEPGLREESRMAIEQDMRRTATGHTMVRRKENLFREDLMTMQQASKHLGITRKTMRRFVDDGAIGAHRAGTAERAPVLVSRKEIEAILKARNGFVPAASLSKKFGFPVMVLQCLARASVLEERANPAGLAPGSYYVEDSVDALLGQLDCRAHPISTRTNLVDLRRAALLAGSPSKNPWPGIFRGVLEGQLKLFSRSSGKALLGRYFLEEAAISRISERALTWPEPADRAPLMRADIGFLLDLPTPSVYALIQDGILSRRPTLSEIQKFYDVFVMSNEAARLLSGSEYLEDWDTSSILSGSGLEPAYTTTYKKRRVWRRRDVLQLARILPTN